MKRVLGILVVLAIGAVALLYGYRAIEALGWDDDPIQIQVIGIDGGEWNAIDSLIAAGEMPNMARLLERGVRADLRTERPSLSPRVWTTIATGKSAEKHGVKDYYADASLVRARRIWEILAEQDWSVGVYGWPISWPPREVDGFIVPGWMARGPETYPPELSFLKEMENQGRNETNPGLLNRAGYVAKGWANGFAPSTIFNLASYVVSERVSPSPFADRYLALRDLQYQFQTDVFVHLRGRHRPRFSAYYSDVVDKVSHIFWKYHEPDQFEGLDAKEVELYGDAVRNAYRRADWAIGQVLADLEDDTIVAVMSDHGFKANSEWLYGKRRIEFDRLLTRLDLKGRLRTFKVALDWYVRAVEDQPERARGVLEEARQKFSQIVLLPDRSPFFRVDDRPDGSLVVRLTDPHRSDLEGRSIEVASENVPLTELFSETLGRGGMHREYGIFLLACENCKSGERIQPIDVLDVTPTLLHVLGVPVADDMEGKVALEAFTQEFASKPIATTDTYDRGLNPAIEREVDDQKMEDLLRSIGYVE